ncbi:hypothetical protein ANCCAN_11607 [Ancylostoma caninum]|uniref:Uncharacterized protein n=1 Tax=Ancylostoma caninum TaxID=29170 RepID=A0A368GDC1_ANCCA|nr:hypothetical protein ANCCAN_11607 [Ancylostoma caninum]
MRFLVFTLKVGELLARECRERLSVDDDTVREMMDESSDTAIVTLAPANAKLHAIVVDQLLEESDIYGLEEFLMGVEDERTREAVIELLEAKQIADEKQVAMRMRRIIRQLPDDVIRKLFEIYKNTFPR